MYLCMCVLYNQAVVESFVEFSRMVETEAVKSMKEDLAYGDIPEEFKGIKFHYYCVLLLL